MRKAVVAVAVVVVAGCSEQAPTDPGAVYRPEFSLSSHSSQFFSFLSPVPPGSQPSPGVFHAYAAPRLDICRVDPSGCVPVTHATLTDYGTGIGALTVDLANEHYATNWTDLNALPRGTYRLSVSGRPLNGTGALQALGTVEVELTASGGSGLQVSGNTLPIKFRILVGAFCESADCQEFAVSNTTGGQFILEEENTVGTFGIQFDPGFLCGPNQTNCADGQVIVTITRYRGPERCIPVAYDAIQWESCVTIRVEPWGVKVTGVTVGMCIEPRADSYAATGHLRMLKVREDAAGVIQPAEIRDLNAVVGQPFFFECSDEFDPAVQFGSATPTGALSRLAGAFASVLGRLLTPPPVHAAVSKGPVIASLEDFSRIGPVLPVRAEFDRDFAVGFPNTLLPAGAAPRARVIATRIPGTTSADYTTTGDRGVSDVAVVFTPAGGTPETVYTDVQGYAVASWTLGAVADNPQLLHAGVFYPVPTLQNGDFPNFTTAWASHTFTAIAQEYNVYFLSPLGTSSGGQPNVTTVTPSVRVCGPLADGATSAPGQSCDPAKTLLLAAPVLTRNGSAWETAWKTDRTTVDNSLYRIDVLVGGYSTGGFLLRRGGGGGSDPAGTYQFQKGSNLPVKFTLER